MQHYFGDDAFVAGIVHSFVILNWAPPKTSGICGCDLIHSPHEEAIMKQAGLFGLSDHLKRLSANGDPL
ncbi:MAG: hypothetical protein ACK519_04575, partial [Sphingomonadaceae bacterium]